MRSSIRPVNETSPEKRLNRLLLRLRTQALKDSLLIFSPVLLASLYIAIHLYRSGWIPLMLFVTASCVALLLGLLAVAVSYWRRRPTLSGTARLVDEATAAQDRFVTLATIEPSAATHPFLYRLRDETSQILGHVEPRRDFPYRVKPSFYKSLAASCFAVILFHLFLPSLQARIPPVVSPEELLALAEELLQRPALSEFAQKAQTLAAQLQDPRISRQEKQALIQELKKTLDEQQQQEEQELNRDLLAKAESTLRGLEQQQSGTRGGQNNTEQGAGQIQSNLPQQGPKGEQSSAGTDASQQDALRGKVGGDQLQPGASAKSESTEQRQNESDGKSTQPDQSSPDSDRQTEGAENASSGREKIGRSKASEEIPRGAPPEERFYRPGEEGKEELKAARYVTVQLPEELGADSKATPSGSPGKSQNRAPTKVPVSNVPLPAHVPDAPAEKQRIPLEYRGVIR